MDNINFGFKMQREINRLGYLPKEQAIYLLGMYLDLNEKIEILQKQLAQSILNYGEYDTTINYENVIN